MKPALSLFFFLAAAISLLLFSCSKEDTPTDTGTGGGGNTETSHLVILTEYSFEPSSLTVNIGDTVTWRNDGNMDHTTTSGTSGSPDGIFASGNMVPQGTPFILVIDSAKFGAGNYPYFCEYHIPQQMTATLIVE